jgi:hypothetical protein
MKSLINVSATLKVLVLMVVLSLSSCNNPFFDPSDWGKDGGQKPDPKTDCSINGKMVKIPCGASIYGALWIQTNDGKLLQPCDQSFKTLCPIVLAEGDQIKFSYHEIKGGSPCDSLIMCMIAQPPHKSVVIDCLTNIGSPTPSLQIDPTAKQENNISVLEAKILGNILKLKVGYSGCNTKTNDTFKLYWDGSLAKSNPAKAYLTIVDTEPQACQAYFTQDLEFDISLLKTYGSPVQVNIQNISILY